MHVCFVNMPIEFYSPVSGGAVATIIMQTAKELLLRGHRVTVLSMVNADPVYDVGHVEPIDGRFRHQLTLPQRALSRLRYDRADWDYPYYEYYIASVKRHLRHMEPSPDIVICFNDFVAPRYVKAVLPDAKVLVNLQNEQGTRQADMTATIDAVDRFVACSRHIRNWTQSTYGIPDEKMVVINNGIDLELFSPQSDYLTPRAALKVLFIGRIDRNKGPDIVADAVRRLRDEGVPVELTVAGGLWFYGHGNEMADPFFRELKAKMDAVHADYKGHVVRSEVPALIRAHDVVCVLSRSNDPNPLVCLEAMASGCAVVGANRGGIPDAFGDAGLLVNPDDIDEVVDVLRRLATDRAFLRRQKQLSVSRAASATWSRAVDRLLDVLKSGPETPAYVPATAVAGRRPLSHTSM